MEPRFLGLDLAWVEKNPSGLAALDGSGRLVALDCDRRCDADVLAWVRANLGSCGAVAVDMPTIVRGDRGTRPCEDQLRADFQRHHAGPYPAHLGLAPFAGGGRGRRLLDELVDDGVVETIAVAPQDPRVVAFEAFPHAAQVRLFGLERIWKYKKKRRAWPDVLAAWASYRHALEQLRNADPPLQIDPELLPHRVTSARYKRWDDAIDAVMCAYVAFFVWRHGSALPRVRVYGDMLTGHIVTPWEPVR